MSTFVETPIERFARASVVLLPIYLLLRSRSCYMARRDRLRRQSREQGGKDSEREGLLPRQREGADADGTEE